MWAYEQTVLLRPQKQGENKYKFGFLVGNIKEKCVTYVRTRFSLGNCFNTIPNMGKNIYIVVAVAL